MHFFFLLNPLLSLKVIAALVSFILKVTLAFGVCSLLDRIVVFPNSRFMLWLGFLCGAVAYWIWLTKVTLFDGGLSPSAAQGTMQTSLPSTGGWHIPSSWAVPLGIALPAIGIVYLLVTAHLLLAYFKNQRRLKKVLSYTHKPPAEISDIFEPLAESLHVSRCRLLILSGVASPATFGWIRPTILLPDLCLEQDSLELESILRHELHHVRRSDFVWNGLGIVCRALLFFHPAAWYAARRMQFHRELACDMAVVSDAPGKRAKYAECLLRFARANVAQDPQPWGIDFAASSAHLQTRIQSILAGSGRTSGWISGLRTATAVVLFVGFVNAVPSATMLFSYARDESSQPSTAEQPISALHISDSGKKTELPTRKVFKGRRRLATETTAADQSSLQADPLAQAQESAVESRSDDRAEGPGSEGPQLLHRNSADSASGNRTKQQTIDLVDSEGSSQVSKTGNHIGQQTVQQTAVAAAALYKGLSTVTHH